MLLQRWYELKKVEFETRAWPVISAVEFLGVVIGVVVTYTARV
jgi:hypothetical protein